MRNERELDLSEPLSSLEDSAPLADESDIFVLPATPSQVRFWSLDQLQPGNHAINMPLAWHCKGELNPEFAAAAFSALVRRHESLRTTFELVEDNLSQIVHPPFLVPLPMEDLQDLSEAAKKQRTDELIFKEARIPMDLKNGPLLFTRLIRLHALEHILLVTMHHIVCDGWSNGVVLRDFAQIYDGFVKGAEPAMPTLPIQFGDYAVWQQEWRASEAAAQSMEFWRKTLGGNFVRLQFQKDFVKSHPESDGEIETHLLPPKFTQELKDFCAREGVTLYMLLMSTFAALLNRVTGQNDFLIGSPCANRRPETEDLIGSFANPQVMRVRLKPENDFRSLLSQVQKWSMGAYINQDLPFEDIMEDAHFLEPANHIQLQSYFLYQKAFMQSQQLSRLEIKPIRSVSPGAMFDLMLGVVERTEGPRLQLEYNPGFFKKATIEGYLRLYVQLLEAAVSRPDALVSEISAVVANVQIPPPEPPQPAKPMITDLSAVASEPKSTEDEPGTPRDAVEAQLLNIWETTLGLKNLGIHSNFFEVGGRSLVAVRLIARINKMYSLNLGLASLFTGNTPEKMAQLVRERLSPHSTSPIVPIQPLGSKTPLFILHGVGGNVVNFYNFGMRASIDHPIYGIQAQSLEANRPALLKLEDMAAYYIEQMRQVQPKGPYYLLGYSFGGSVALEMAHQLTAQGETIGLLGMLDSRQRDYMEQMQKHDSLITKVGRSTNRVKGAVEWLSFGERLRYFKERGRRLALRWTYAVAATMGRKTIAASLRVPYDINFVAAMRYKPRPYAGKIILFRATIQMDPRLPRDLGWGNLIQDGIEVFDLPGDHEDIFREPNIHVLLDKLHECLSSRES
jgi:thioesterase domain-containing protein